MFSAFRNMEIVLFSLAIFLPYVLLSVYAFSNQLRYSKKVIWIVCFLLLTVQFATRYWSALHSINTSVRMSMIRLIIFMDGYMILFRAHWGKQLFVELVYANMGNFILIAAVCIERNLFPDIVHRTYCWHTSVVILLLHLIFTLPLYFAVKKWLKPMLNSKQTGNEWCYYWLVPTVFYVIWQYQVNGGKGSILENMSNPYNVIFLFIINIGSVLIYFLMLKLNAQLVKNLELEIRNYYLNLEQIEYQNLSERIEETRRARHDLRHHIHIMSHYLEEKEYDKLEAYLNTYRNSLPDGREIPFCQNRTINSLILYFASQAREHEIDFQVQLAIPEQVNVADNDISVLLGNLLENAIDACAEQQHSKRRIIINGKGDKHSLVFTIDNTCENEIKKNKRGDFLTTKPDGSGIGVSSAQKIVERYHGIFSADKKGDMFYVSFMLNL